MDSHQQPVGPGGHRRASHRQHLVAPSRAVRRIADHRQMRQPLHHRDRRNIHGVARVRLKRPYAALAQDDFVIPAAHDVFSREQQFLDRRRDAALQQHRLAQFAQLAQQIEILHIARAHLQDVGVRVEQRDLRVVHHLAHHQQAPPVRGRPHELKPGFAHALKTVRRRARLESSAAHDLRASRGDDIRDGLDLIPALHAARARHRDHLRAADLNALDLNHRSLRLEIPASKLVGGNNPVALLHAVHDLEVRGIEIVDRSHSAEHRVQHACRTVHGESHAHQAVDHGLNLLLGRPLLHYH